MQQLLQQMKVLVSMQISQDQKPMEEPTKRKGGEK